MPYIPQADRERARRNPRSNGELNYAITCVILEEQEKHGLRYATANAIYDDLETIRDYCESEYMLATRNYNYPTMASEIASLLTEFGKERRGTMSCLMREYYRRVVAKLEDFKCGVNGDVYPEVIL